MTKAQAVWDDAEDVWQDAWYLSRDLTGILGRINRQPPSGDMNGS